MGRLQQTGGSASIPVKLLAGELNIDLAPRDALGVQYVTLGVLQNLSRYPLKRANDVVLPKSGPSADACNTLPKPWHIGGGTGWENLGLWGREHVITGLHAQWGPL